MRVLLSFLRGDGPLPKPGKGAWQLFASTFFFFSVIGHINTLSRVQSVPDVHGTLIAALLAGSIAVGYAYAIANRKWWLLVLPLVTHFYLASNVIFPFFEKIDLTEDVRMPEPEALRSRSVAIWGTIAGLTLGQIFMVRFIATITRRNANDRAELAVAQRIHTRMVPAITMQAGDFTIEGLSDTSQRMGGDLCDAVQVGKVSYAIVADVCGHGVGAGLIMTMVKGCVRTRLVQGGDLPSILKDVNAVLCDQLSEGAFVTVAFARIEGDLIEIALAGHPPVFVAGQDGLRQIDNENVPLGLRANEEFSSQKVVLTKGEAMLLYTDGLFERVDETDLLGGKDLGVDGLAKLFARACAKRELSASSLMLAMRGPQPPADDQTLIVISRT